MKPKHASLRLKSGWCHHEVTLCTSTDSLCDFSKGLTWNPNSQTAKMKSLRFRIRKPTHTRQSRLLTSSRPVPLMGIPFRASTSTSAPSFRWNDSSQQLSPTGRSLSHHNNGHEVDYSSKQLAPPAPVVMIGLATSARGSGSPLRASVVKAKCDLLAILVHSTEGFVESRAQVVLQSEFSSDPLTTLAPWRL